MTGATREVYNLSNISFSIYNETLQFYFWGILYSDQIYFYDEVGNIGLFSGLFTLSNSLVYVVVAMCNSSCIPLATTAFTTSTIGISFGYNLLTVNDVGGGQVWAMKIDSANPHNFSGYITQSITVLSNFSLQFVQSTCISSNSNIYVHFSNGTLIYLASSGGSFSVSNTYQTQCFWSKGCFFDSVSQSVIVVYGN